MDKQEARKQPDYLKSHTCRETRNGRHQKKHDTSAVAASDYCKIDSVRNQAVIDDAN